MGIPPFWVYRSFKYTALLGIPPLFRCTGLFGVSVFLVYRSFRYTGPFLLYRLFRYTHFKYTAFLVYRPFLGVPVLRYTVPLGVPSAFRFPFQLRLALAMPTYGTGYWFLYVQNLQWRLGEFVQVSSEAIKKYIYYIDNNIAPCYYLIG